MSYVETETLVSSSDTHSENDRDVRQRKVSRIHDLPQLLSRHNSVPRRLCRRHSFAFRCSESELAEHGDEGKHYESVLLVRVCYFFAKS